MGFGASVLANGQKLLEKTNDKCLAIAKELFVSIVNLSPSPIHPGSWADGLLVNQWYPAVGSFSNQVGTSTSPYGAESIARIYNLTDNSTAFKGKDGMVTLSNNVSYAYRAEALGWPADEGWTGKVGPYLMVAKSLQAVSARNR
jgi:hypothetical protein